MPYSLPSNIPDYIKNLPVGAQSIFVEVFNAALHDGKTEEEARIAGWGAVKTTYEKHGEEWVRKAKEEPMFKVTSLADAYALHNQMHSEYATMQMGQRRREGLQTDHEGLIARILELGGIHQAKGDQLDETLPVTLRGALTARYVTPLIALVDATAPISRIQVLRTGTFYHPIYGKFTVSETDLQTMVHNFQLKRPKLPTEMVVDYEHMSAPGQPPAQAPAAGWVKGCEQQGNELYCLVEWTPKAADQIRAKEYRFISPEFTLNYRDKETNKPIGPTLLALALTNRPFVEGMQPVALSDEVAGAVAFALSEHTIKNFNQLDKAEELLLAGTAADVAIALADWDTAYINDLPDSAFAYIKPGGDKDEGGKTVPRSLRFLPYRNNAGGVDLPHLRNALARLPQTSLSPEEKQKAQGVLDEAAKAAGVGAPAEESAKTMKEAIPLLDEKQLRTILKLSDVDSIPDALNALVAKAAKADEATQQLSTIKAKEVETDAIALVDKAIADRKLLPKQKDAAKVMCLKDKAGFVALMAEAPVVGPDTKEKGNAGNSLEVVITATEKTIAAKMGVTDEQLLKVKQADAAAASGAAKH